MSTTLSLDLRGEVCPYTFVLTKLKLEELAVGETLAIHIDHAPAKESVPRALIREGHQVTSVDADGAGWRIVVVKRTEHRLKESHP